MGLCPFHDERTPSFSVDAQEKLYHCFGCGVGGDVIKFVEEKEGLGFAEAVELLADRYGVELEREQEDPRAEARRQQRQRLQAAARRAPQPFTPATSGSRRREQSARVPGRRGPWRGGAAELRRRLRPERLGQDPRRADSGPDSKSRSCAASGWSSEAAGQASTTASGRGSCSRSAIDAVARSASAAGRCASDQGAKYVNTAETDFFHKSQMLYGHRPCEGGDREGEPGGRGRGLHRRSGAAPGGIEEAVGVMGTAITDEQVAALSGMVEEVVLALDADSAGQEAMLRAQRVAAGRKMRIAGRGDACRRGPGRDDAPPRAARSTSAALSGAAIELTAFRSVWC